MNSDTFFKKGNVAFGAGRYQDALNFYRKAISKSEELKSQILFNAQMAERKIDNVRVDPAETIVVYTCNMGGYESVKEPLYKDPNVEYILFTDDKDLKSDGWKVVHINERLSDPRRTSRLPKILAHKYLPPHDISVYIDSSLEIKETNISKMVADCLVGHDIALYPHYKRDCVYEEIEFVMNSKGGRVAANVELCKNAIQKYRAINYPENGGLYENAFIVRRNSRIIEKLNELWWAEYQRGAERDQFTLMYALWVLSIAPNAISIGEQFRSNPYVNFFKHKYNSYSRGALRPDGRLSLVVNDYEDERFNEICSAIASESIKVVSFDIFDTLVIRNVYAPKDIFSMLSCSADVRSVFGHHDFFELRTQAETDVRKALVDQGRKEDPTLDSIYKRIGEKCRVSERDLAKIKDLELSYELDFIDRNEALAAVFDFALQQGKKIIITTDMYLPRLFIEKLLYKHGFHGYTELFLSSDCGYTKKFGDIYPYICAKLQVAPNNILHIGDNIKSDITNAQNFGLLAMRVHDVRKKFLDAARSDDELKGCVPSYNRSSEIVNLSTRLNYGLLLRKYYSASVSGKFVVNTPKKLGYLVLGPFVLSLVLKIRRRASELGLRQFLWLARDGHLPSRANDLISNVLGCPFDSVYLPISRKMLFPLYLEDEVGLDYIFNIPYQDEYLVSNFIDERFGEVGRALLNDALGKDYDVIKARYMFEYHEIIYGILREKFTVIKDQFSDASSELKQYYGELVKAGEIYGLFDVGRKGTFQRVLGGLCGADIYGFYVVNNKNIYDNVGLEFDSFLGVNDKIARTRTRDTIIYELFLSDLEGSFQEVLAGKAVRGDKKLGIAEAQFIEEVQNAALSYVSDAVAQFGEKLHLLEQDPFYAAYGMENGVNNIYVKKLFSDVPHYDEMSTNEPRNLSDVFEKRLSKDRYLLFPPKSERKRVVIYSPAMTRVRGGAERVASRLAEYFDRAGFEVLLISSGKPDSSNRPVYEISPTIFVRNVNVGSSQSVSRLLTSFSADCGFVLASGSVLINLARAFVQSNVPFMLSERADPSASLRTYWEGYSYEDYNVVYSSANLISVQFDSFVSFFNERLRPQILTLANPFKLPTVDMSKGREKVIVCAARIWFVQKRQDLLLEAFSEIHAKHPEWRLEFYGNSYGDDAEKLRELAISKGVSDKVSINSSISEIDRVFERSAIFAMPSAFEGFPNSLAEALSFGVPAVGFASCPGVNELIRDGVNGCLAQDSSASSFADKLAVLMSDEDLRLRMAAGAVESMKKYDESEVFDVWANALNLLVREKTRTQSEIANILACLPRK